MNANKKWTQALDPMLSCLINNREIRRKEYKYDRTLWSNHLYIISTPNNKWHHWILNIWKAGIRKQSVYRSQMNMWIWFETATLKPYKNQSLNQKWLKCRLPNFQITCWPYLCFSCIYNYIIHHFVPMKSSSLNP